MFPHFGHVCDLAYGLHEPTPNSQLESDILRILRKPLLSSVYSFLNRLALWDDRGNRLQGQKCLGDVTYFNVLHLIQSHNSTDTFDNYCNKETCIFQKLSTPLFFDQEISLLQAKFSNILWRSTLENNCQGILPSCKWITKDFITVRKEELCDYPYMKAHTHVLPTTQTCIQKIHLFW